MNELNLQSSQITCLYECERKWYYNYYLKRCKPSTGPMNRGSCFHLCGELYLRNGVPLEKLPEVISEMKPDYAIHLPEVMPVFATYLDHYEGQLDIDEIDGKKAVELEFKLDLGNGIIVRGKIDFVRKQQGKRYISDWKVTSSHLNDSFFSKFELAPQTQLYSYVGKEYFEGLNGFIIDAVQITDKKVDFKRSFFPFLPNMDEFISEIYHLGCKVLENLGNEDAFPHRWSSCINRYHRRCAYYDVCRSTARIREGLLMSDDFIDYAPIYDEST